MVGGSSVILNSVYLIMILHSYCLLWRSLTKVSGEEEI